MADLLKAIHSLIQNPDVAGDDAREQAAAAIQNVPVYIQSRPQGSEDIAIVLSVDGGEVQPIVNRTAKCQQTAVELEVWAKGRTDRNRVGQAATIYGQLAVIFTQYRGAVHNEIEFHDSFEESPLATRDEPPRDASDDWHTVIFGSFVFTHSIKRGDKIRV